MSGLATLANLQSLPRRLVRAFMGADEDRVRGPVSLAKAMSIPVVKRCVGRIVGDASLLPLFLYRKIGRGSEKADNHWAYDLLKSRPNAIQSSMNFREQLFLHTIMMGNGRAAIFGRGRRDAELIILDPTKTASVLVDGDKFHVYTPEKDDRISVWDYVPDNGNKTFVFPDEEVIHLHRFGCDGICGIGLIESLRLELGLSMAQDEFAYNQTSKGFSAKLMIEVPTGQLREAKDAKEFIDGFNEANSKPQNAGKAALLREGMKVQTLNMSNADSEFLAQRRFSATSIASALGYNGVPGDGENHSYNSDESDEIAYWKHVLLPWTCLYECEIDRKILSERDRNEGYYSRYNYGAILRTDAQTQASVISIYRSCNVLSGNDARELLDMNPYEGGDSYENPNTSSGGPSNQPKNPGKQKNSAHALIESTLRALIKVEANNAKNGAKKADFCGWIDKNYAKWEAKLASKLEEIGLDRDLATEHCSESKELLLNVAGESKPEQLETNVAKCVATWEDRVYSLMEAMQNA